jgi:hypothetical protein
LNFTDFLKVNKPEWFNLDRGHNLIARAIDTAATCKQDTLILAPPRCGKSTIFADLLPRWLTEARKAESVIVACGSSEIADDWRKRFNATTSEDVQRRVHFVGTGAPLCGRGADVFILDPCTLDNPRLSEWYDSTVRPRLMPNGYVIAIDNRWGSGDFASHLMRQGVSTTYIMREMLYSYYSAEMLASVDAFPSDVLRANWNQCIGAEKEAVKVGTPANPLLRNATLGEVEAMLRNVLAK